MISRYSRPEMAALWSDEARFKVWLEVELAALDAMADEGIVPKETARTVRAKARFDAARILEIEREVKHDVLSFLKNVEELTGPEARFLHRGMTSSDLLDTAFAVQLKRAGELILLSLDSAVETVRRRAEEHKLTPCIGRTHGIHAEPTTFGVKLLTWCAELKRARARLVAALAEVTVGSVSGAVGTYHALPPAVERRVLERLGLGAEPVPSQIVHRDRHAAFFSALALLATSIERCCVEVRHLQRTEVREVQEEFSAGQKGSSAMPHKRNPILSENLTGLARLVRAYSQAALENVPLWHERDISHSSVERVIGPDAAILTDFMLHRFNALVSGLVVFPERMKENLDLTNGLVFSGSLLVALVEHGVSREESYKIVQRHALAAWEGGADLRERVLADEAITGKIPAAELDQVFDLNRHFRHVEMLFARADAARDGTVTYTERK